MEPSRISFRCPHCGTEGKARAELVGRRVTCKQCSQIFRAAPADSPPTAPTSIPTSADTLRAELQAALRERDTHADQIADLQRQLTEAHAAREALGDRAAEADGLRAEAEHLRAELAALRNRLDEMVAHQAATMIDLDVRALRDLADFRDRCDQLGQEVADRTRERDEATAALEQARDQIAGAEAAGADLRATLAAIEARCNETDATTAELRAALAQARHDADAASEQTARDRDREADRSREHQAAMLAFEERHQQGESERDRLRVEAESLVAHLAEAHRVAEDHRAAWEELRNQSETSLAAQAEELLRARAEVERLREIAAKPPVVAPVPELRSPSPPETNATRESDADPTGRSAWADFERRLADTQNRLRAADTRAALAEDEARRALAELDQLRSQMESGSDDWSGVFAASMTTQAIHANRGGPALTIPEAEARLQLARQVAAERKDRHLIDRIDRAGESVRDDLSNQRQTLAESLVRGLEIEAGIDPGGWSVGGLRVFRPSPTVSNSLEALALAHERVMRQGDRSATLTLVREFHAILGDQAGLPDLRMSGRRPAVQQPISPADAARLFLDVLATENWLIRPVEAGRTPPDTALSSYAAIVEAMAEVREPVARLVPDRLVWFDRILDAAAGMLVRRQLADGHMPFLDPRGKASRLSTTIDALVARRPDAVRDGWIVGIDSAGAAQVETGMCAVALAKAANATDRREWSEAAGRAATWVAGQPNLPNYLANAHSARALALVHQARPQPVTRDALLSRLNLGLLPWQADNGRWLDPATAQTTSHLRIHQALRDAADALGTDALDDLGRALDPSLDTLLEEWTALGVPDTGGALPTLVRERDQAAKQGRALDPRVGPALRDSATLVTEVCRDGGRLRLAVPVDVLAALVRV